MLNKKIYLIILFLFLTLFSVSAISEINDFTKLKSYPSDYRINGTLILNNPDYVIGAGKFYDSSTWVNYRNTTDWYGTIQEYVYYHDNYYFKPANLKANIMLENGTVFNSSNVFSLSGGVFAYFTNMVKYSESVILPTDYLVYFDTSSYVKYGMLGIFNISNQNNMTWKCGRLTDHYSTNNGAAGGSPVPNYLIGLDEDYIFSIEPNNTNQRFKVYDYDCNIIYVTNFTASSSSVDGVQRSITSFTEGSIKYDDDNYFFLGLYNNTEIITFDTTGDSMEKVVLNNVLPANITINNTRNSCTYDRTNNDYYCIGYRGTLGNFSVVKVTFDDTGGYVSTDEYDYNYFNIPGFDEYNLYQYVTIFMYEDNLYVQLFDTVGSTYDLFRGTIGSYTIYDGLTCNSDYSLCYDSDNTCYPNDGFFYTGQNTSNWLCNATLLDPQNTIYCNSAPSQCTGGCVNNLLQNAYFVNYYSATCYTDTSCTNECGVLGLTYSDTLTTYAVCRADGDNDPCLEFVQYTCGTGNISINGACQPSNTSINDIEIINFGGIPYPGVNIIGCVGNDLECYNNNLWNVTLSSNPYKLNVQTRTDLGGSGAFPLALQLPFLGSTDYVGFECNYKSTKNIYNPSTNITLLGHNVKELTVNETITFTGSTRNYETLTFIVNNTHSFNVYVMDVANKELGVYYVFFNVSSGEITVYDELGGDLLYTFTYDNSFTVGKLEMLLYQDSYLNLQNSLIKIYRYIDNNNQPLLDNLGVNMIPLTDSLSIGAGKIIIEPLTGQVYLNKGVIESITSSISTIAPASQFKDAYRYVGCVYVNTGCYIQRTYAQERAGSQYFSYEDLEICINTVNGGGITPGNSLEDILGGGKGKLILGFVIPMIAFLLFLGFSTSINDDSQKRIAVYVGAFLFIAGILLFTALNWLPVWILIIALVLSGLLAMVFFIKKAQGG